jgi:hypothetical protein
MVARFFNYLCLLGGGLMVFRITSQEEKSERFCQRKCIPAAKYRANNFIY